MIFLLEFLLNLQDNIIQFIVLEHLIPTKKMCIEKIKKTFNLMWVD